jgi:hypothetical protein
LWLVTDTPEHAVQDLSEIEELIWSVPPAFLLRC